MAFNTNNGQNNSREAANVNTKGLSFFNKDGYDGGAAFLIGYWNGLISLRMHPALELSKQTETRKFDYEKVVSTALTPEKAFILATKIEKEILPAIEKDEAHSVGIPVGSDSLLIVSTGKKLIGSIAPYIAIHKSLDPKTKLPSMSMYYSFNSDISIDNYDETTGAFEMGPSLNAELMVFLNVLKTSIIGLGNSTVHASRCVDKYFKDKLNSDIGEIAGKLGITITGPQKNSYGRGDIFSNGGRQENSSRTEPQTNVENLSNIDDIEKFLN